MAEMSMGNVHGNVNLNVHGTMNANNEGEE